MTAYGFSRRNKSMLIAQSAKRVIAWTLAVSFSAGLFLGLAQRPLLAQSADPDPDIHRVYALDPKGQFVQFFL